MSLELWQSIITGVALIVALVIAVYSWRSFRPLSIGVLVWFAVALVLSQRGFFQDSAGWRDGDLVGFAIFGTLMTVPLVIFFVGWWRYADFRRFLNSIPLPALIGIEIYRVAGAIFWWLYTASLMPPEMGIFTSFADVFIGLTALPLAWAVARRLRGSRPLAVVWNIFGISDFVIAVSLVSLSITGLITLQPDPVMIGLHPLALIALFQLPLSIAIHAVALSRLSGRIEQAGRDSASPMLAANP